MADQLKQVILETLSPQKEVRQRAEGTLQAASTTQGHALSVLELVAKTASSGGAGAGTTSSDDAVRQAAAVHFKNLIKRGWDPHANEDTGTNDSGIVLSPDDRTTIKSHLVQLMCTVPPQIQSQLSESISLIAAVDYPQQWQNLLPDLVQQFSSTDPTVVVGVLTTAE